VCDSSAKARVVPPITRVVASAVDNAKDNILFFSVDFSFFLLCAIQYNFLKNI
jgi:hypothetical protein